MALVQWAAVTTQLSLIIVAPQNTPIVGLYKLHLQGNSLTAASVPPTILGDSFRIPQEQELLLEAGAIGAAVLGRIVVGAAVAGATVVAACADADPATTLTKQLNRKGVVEEGLLLSLVKPIVMMLDEEFVGGTLPCPQVSEESLSALSPLGEILNLSYLQLGSYSTLKSSQDMLIRDPAGLLKV